MLCRYCGKVCKNENSHRNHERTCPSNPDRVYKNGMQGKEAWNKGLTKSTDPRIAEAAEKSKGRKGKKWSKEMREKHSKRIKDLFQRRPELHPNRRLAGNFHKMTYPETVAHNWLVRKSIPFTHNKRVGKYFPDFTIGSIIIEIDGERWHPEGCEKDRLRDEELKSLGYLVFRIRTSECIEDELAKIFGKDPDPNSFKPPTKEPKPPTKTKAKVKVLSNPPLTKEQIDARFSQVMESGIDLFVRGWVAKVSELWGVSHTQVRRVFDEHWKGLKPFRRVPKSNS